MAMEELNARFMTAIGMRDCIVGDLLSFGFQQQSKIQALDAGDGTPSELKKYEQYKIKLEELVDINKKLNAIIKERIEAI